MGVMDRQRFEHCQHQRQAISRLIRRQRARRLIFYYGVICLLIGWGIG